MWRDTSWGVRSKGGEVADGRLAPRQAADDRPASGVAQGGEGGVQVALDIGRRGEVGTLKATDPLRNVFVVEGCGSEAPGWASSTPGSHHVLRSQH